MSDTDIDAVASLLREARSVVVLTGAGISTDSGIPDFPRPRGCLDEEPRRRTDRHHPALRGQPRPPRPLLGESRRGAPCTPLSRMPATSRLPSSSAKASSTRSSPRTSTAFTTMPEPPPERIIEIHGTVRDFACLDCTDRGPIEVVLERVRDGDEDPHCNSCGGLLKSATISFGPGAHRKATWSAPSWLPPTATSSSRSAPR